MDHDVFIDADGLMQLIYDDDVAGLFVQDESTTRRASHVEPATTISPGTDGWLADMRPCGGRILTSDRKGGYRESLPPFLDGWPFTTRAEALAAEVVWLKAQMAQRRLEVQP